MPVIFTKQLGKQYGRIRALDNVSLDVESGQVFGLLGQNGAGKSTLIKILLGIVHTTEGEAELLGQPIGDTATRGRIGYLPEDHRFPIYHTALSILDTYGLLYGMSRSERQRRSMEALERVNLKKRAAYKIGSFSKGMKQRLGIAQAIFHQPDLIFLDEPTDGVDPVGRKEIRGILEGLRNEGRTIFLNSHLLGEVELICNRVAIMHGGRLVREGTVDDLTRQADHFLIGVAEGQSFPREQAEQLGYTVIPNGTLFDVELPIDGSIDPLLELLHSQGVRLRHLVGKKQTLEEVFVGMVDQAEPARNPKTR